MMKTVFFAFLGIWILPAIPAIIFFLVRLTLAIMSYMVIGLYCLVLLLCYQRFFPSSERTQQEYRAQQNRPLRHMHRHLVEQTRGYWYQPSATPTVTCIGCLDHLENSWSSRRKDVKLPCSHHFCLSCLQRGAAASIAEGSFPPTCCGISYLQVVLNTPDILAPDTKEKLRERQQELMNPADNVYCSNKDCGRFIPTQNRSRDLLLAECRHCYERTCILCSASYHGKKACEVNPLEKKAEEEVVELAEKEGWRRCPRCLWMVELWDGCYHVSCRCGANFCYLCGAAWKTCGCAQYPYQRNSANQGGLPQQRYHAAQQEYAMFAYLQEPPEYPPRIPQHMDWD